MLPNNILEQFCRKLAEIKDWEYVPVNEDKRPKNQYCFQSHAYSVQIWALLIQNNALSADQCPDIGVLTVNVKDKNGNWIRISSPWDEDTLITPEDNWRLNEAIMPNLFPVWEKQFNAQIKARIELEVSMQEALDAFLSATPAVQPAPTLPVFSEKEQLPVAANKNSSKKRKKK